MLNVGPAELLVVLVVALLVLGPNKLPDAARQVGRALAELRRMSSGFQAEMRDALREPVEGRPGPARSTTAASAAEGNGTLSSPRAPAGAAATEAAVPLGGGGAGGAAGKGPSPAVQGAEPGAAPDAAGTEPGANGTSPG